MRNEILPSAVCRLPSSSYALCPSNMSEFVFVEEYRKELATTGYPFSRYGPLTTRTGYTLAAGSIIDASVYYDNPQTLPTLTAIEKKDHLITFSVGEYRGTLDLRETSETVELKTEGGLFGGVLVVDRTRYKTIQSWPSGVHPLRPPGVFCPRCLEFIPALGVQRFRSDTGELFSGHVAIVAGKGSILRTKKAGIGFDYVEINHIGDPTWLARHGLTGPSIRTIVCIDSGGNKVSLVPGQYQGIEIVACNTAFGNLFDDALRIGASGSSIHLSLAGL